jgi:hypothetical protein
MMSPVGSVSGMLLRLSTVSYLTPPRRVQIKVSLADDAGWKGEIGGGDQRNHSAHVEFVLV